MTPRPFWDTLMISPADRKSTRLNSSHSQISYAVFCLYKNEPLAGDFEGTVALVDHIFRPHSGQYFASTVTGLPQLGHGELATWGGVMVLPPLAQTLQP